MIKPEYLAKEFEHYGGIIEKAYNKTIIQITRDTSKFILSPSITREVVYRFLSHKDLIEDYHPGIKGSDAFKIAGYLTYWIAKLKPVQILDPNPTEEEIFINEYLAIAVAVSYFYMDKNIKILSKKIINNLKYLLRYRTLTVRIMPLIYESYINGFWEGADQATMSFGKKQ